MDTFDLRNWPNLGKTLENLSDPIMIDQITIDSRRVNSKESVFIALKGELHDGHDYVAEAAQAGAKYAIVNQTWKSSVLLEKIILLRVPDPLRAFQEIAKAYRLHLPTKVVAITGSFGKTMVKDLLHAFLTKDKKAAASPESFNSQIGVPLSLLTLRQEHEIAVIEAAISEKNEMDYLVDIIQPDYTLLTPIGKKHLVTLEDMSTLVEEIMKMILATPANGWSLLPTHSLLNESLLSAKCPYYFWDQSYQELPNAFTTLNEPQIPFPYQISFPNQKPFQGSIKTGYSYFVHLLNMAIKSAWLLGISSKSIIEVLLDYQPEPMRTEIWKSPIGSTFINDTYCSDPQSVDLSLRHFNHAMPEQKKIFFFGGMSEQRTNLETDYRRIGKALSNAKIDKLILFGNKEFEPLIKEINSSQTAPEVTICSDSNEAIKYLQLTIHPQDLVLIKGEKKVSLEVITEAFNESLNNNQCIINFAAIQSNIATIRKKLPPSTRIMVIVKALAYGTDDIRMSKFLSNCGVDILGVSYVDEGVALKRAGVHLPIFSINAALYEAAKVVKWDLEVGISDKEFVQVLGTEALKKNKQIKVHLHINTGMGRFGCRPEEALDIAKTILSFESLRLEGLMTHFACAEEASEDPFTHTQINCFDQVIAQLAENHIKPTWIHAANSSGAIRFSLPQYNMVRIGLAAYGLYSSEETKQNLDLRLALSLSSRIVGINICKKGESVSYGRCYTVERDEQKIAVLPIGYFDGLHRNYSGKAYVLIRGMKAPMVGRICMDYMMVDVSDIPNVKVGDKVLIFGEDDFGQYLSPEDLAHKGNSIVHELITCLGPRIQRIFIYEESNQIR